MKMTRQCDTLTTADSCSGPTPWTLVNNAKESARHAHRKALDFLLNELKNQEICKETELEALHFL